jgi:hypothetical protein
VLVEPELGLGLRAGDGGDFEAADGGEQVREERVHAPQVFDQKHPPSHCAPSSLFHLCVNFAARMSQEWLDRLQMQTAFTLLSRICAAYQTRRLRTLTAPRRRR